MKEPATTDCLIIGYNDYDFGAYAEMVAAMGPDHGAYRDLRLAFVEHRGKKYRALDLLSHIHFEGRKGTHGFHNADFLWPVVLYLKTYLERRGLTCDYVNLFHLEKEKLEDRLLHGDVLTVAVTTTLYVSPQPILEIVSFIRQRKPEVKIVVGGPYVRNQLTAMDTQSLHWLFDNLGADHYVISEEGEGALVELLQALKSGGSLAGVKNLAYRENGGWVVNELAPEANSLADNPVDYRLFERRELGQMISLRTAKSCPFSCSFCGFPQRAGKYTYLPVPLVEQELDALAEMGVTTLTFLDDTFNVPKKRFKEILRLMIRKQYGFHWNSFYRSDHGDEETIELMAAAGCEGVFLGVESGSDAMLERMNKTSRRRNYLAAIPRLQGAGISCHASLIIGFPGETLETVEESVSLVEETRPDYFRAQLWYADPVTPIWGKRDRYGVTGEAFSWSHDTMDSETACDLVDALFLSVEGSTWMPQYGFEQWSTFYLQRHGMTREQVRDFVRLFNGAVKEQLIDPGRRQITRELAQNLLHSAQFDRGEKPDLASLQPVEAAGRRLAESLWPSRPASSDGERQRGESSTGSPAERSRAEP